MLAIYKSPIPQKRFAPGHTHEEVEVIKNRAGYCLVRPKDKECIGTFVRTKYLIML